ncbi:MAG: helix-turn-helix domain-containing protein [Chlorobiota bacterium]
MNTQIYDKRIVDMTAGELIELIKQNTPNPVIEEQESDKGSGLLTIKEACEYLRVSQPTLHALMNKNNLDFIKVNRRTFIKKTAIEEFLERNTI